MNEMSTMLNKKWHAYNCVICEEPVLQADILDDEMKLEKMIMTLSLVYYAFKLDVQSNESQILSSEFTLICISSTVALNWYTDYNRFFVNHLKIWFVESSFRHDDDSVFKSCCIDDLMFKRALNDSKNCPLYKSLKNSEQIMFMS